MPYQTPRVWTKKKALAFGMQWEGPDYFQGRDFVRQKVRERDKHTCQRCNKVWKKGMRRFDVHCEGKDTRKYWSVEDMPKMKTYCHKCSYLKYGTQ